MIKYSSNCESGGFVISESSSNCFFLCDVSHLIISPEHVILEVYDH